MKSQLSKVCRAIFVPVGKVEYALDKRMPCGLNGQNGQNGQIPNAE